MFLKLFKIKTTIYREKDETSALPASANWY